MEIKRNSASVEPDILSVLRDLEGKSPDKAKPEKEIAEKPDPQDLLSSLNRKKRLITMLDGYMERADAENIKKQLSDAITDLETIIKTV